jgi:Protein of Unknown function (DUF2784)
MDQVLNISFFAFHSSWILFNCLGWIWRQTRAWQLATVSLTALSWFGLGIWYGWGYCPCTEWHWQVRARLGHHDPPSYIQLMIHEVFGVGLSPNAADAVALVTLTAVAVISIRLNLRDWRAARRRPSSVRPGKVRRLR